MSKHIHATFTTEAEALTAKNVMIESGLTDVDVNGSDIDLIASDDNWIAAFEIVNSLGGTIDPTPKLTAELEEFYQILDEVTDGGVDVVDPIQIVDRDAYIDMNVGYGDYELIEPYTLHNYEKIADGEDKELDNT
jgi:hypothetical protein